MSSKQQVLTVCHLGRRLRARVPPYRCGRLLLEQLLLQPRQLVEARLVRVRGRGGGRVRRQLVEAHLVRGRVRLRFRIGVRVRVRVGVRVRVWD